MGFTEKGREAIKVILEKYPDGGKFRAKDIGVATQTLSCFVREGYLIKEDTKPITYIFTNECKQKVIEDLSAWKSFRPYSMEEFTYQADLSYTKLVEYLANKYGRVTGAYFCNEAMKGQNKKILRSSEGLEVHHIMEDRAVQLCTSIYAQQSPWEYQLPHNLVYCNVFEHLLLHIRIVLECDFKLFKPLRMFPGVGGIDHIYNKIKIQSYKEKISYESFNKIYNMLMEKVQNTELYCEYQKAKEDYINQRKELIRFLMGETEEDE